MKQFLSTLKSPLVLPAEPPQWWQVLPYGEVFILGDDQPLVMDDETAGQVLAYFADLGRDMVVDYEHQTLGGGQAPAAGWIKELQWRGKEGLWARTEWTERAAAYIAAKEYRYFSPVMISRNSDRRIVALINVALTNEPKTRNIQAIAAKLDITNLQTKEQPMFIQALRKIFKLTDDAGEAAVTGAAEALVAKNADLEKRLAEGGKVVAAKNVLAALGLAENADEQTVVAKINGLSATGTAAADLSAQVAALNAKIAAMEVEDLTALALKDGKTSPEELEKWGRKLAKENPEQFRLIVLSRPAGSVLPTKRAKILPDSMDGATPDDVQVSINKMLGIDNETYKKFGPQEA